jgi:hypothetical protein
VLHAAADRRIAQASRVVKSFFVGLNFMIFLLKK